MHFKSYRLSSKKSATYRLYCGSSVWDLKEEKVPSVLKGLQNARLLRQNVPGRAFVAWVTQVSQEALGTVVWAWWKPKQTKPKEYWGTEARTKFRAWILQGKGF